MAQEDERKEENGEDVDMTNYSEPKSKVVTLEKAKEEE